MKSLSKIGIQTAPGLKGKILFKTNSPIHLSLLLLPVLWGFAYYGFTTETYSLIQRLICLITGFILYLPVEYLFHRFIFHNNSLPSSIWNLSTQSHQEHHQNPKDPYAFGYPPMITLMSVFLFFLIFAVITFSLTLAALLSSGLIFFHLIFEWLHDSFHRYELNYPILRFLKKGHMIHHYKASNKNFATTNGGLVDRLFKTYQA